MDADDREDTYRRQPTVNGVLPIHQLRRKEIDAELEELREKETRLKTELAEIEKKQHQLVLEELALRRFSKAGPAPRPK